MNSVLHKRSELLTVIESECPDIICIIETLPKNQGERTDPAELQLQDFDCFHKDKYIVSLTFYIIILSKVLV